MQQTNVVICSSQTFHLLTDFERCTRLFALLCSNQDNNVKRYKCRKYYLPNANTKNYNVTINGKKNLCDQPIDSGIKKYDENRKLTAVQGEYYPVGCLLDYEHTKNHYSTS